MATLDFNPPFGEMFDMLNVSEKSLGIRLDATTDDELNLLARERRQTKSDLARLAIRQFLERERPTAEWDRQLAMMAIADADDPALAAEIEALQWEAVKDMPPAPVRQ